MSVIESNAVLRGGPSSYLPEDQRIRHVEELDQTVKLLRGNRYEHFAPTPDVELHDGRSLRVFVWEGATKLAE